MGWAGPISWEGSLVKRIPLLIAGLGNVLMKDDGLGVHAVRRLMRDPVEGAEIVEVGCAVLDAIGFFEDAKFLLALDAVQAGEKPGTIYEVTPGGSNWGRIKGSMHDLGLREALQMIEEKKRPEVLVLGVEPEVDGGVFGQGFETKIMPAGTWARF